MHGARPRRGPRVAYADTLNLNAPFEEFLSRDGPTTRASKGGNVPGLRFETPVGKRYDLTILT